LRRINFRPPDRKNRPAAQAACDIERAARAARLHGLLCAIVV